jgi:hypothetical protein
MRILCAKNVDVIAKMESVMDGFVLHGEYGVSNE